MLYVLASTFGIMGKGSLVGASGGVLGLLAACAVLFPRIQVILILFPMQIRTAAILFAVMFMLIVLTGGENAGGHLCHLGGMATGYLWVMGKAHFGQMGIKLQKGTWEKKQQKRAQLQYEVDRILAKVHQEGIHSLTRKEKQILQKATEDQKRG